MTLESGLNVVLSKRSTWSGGVIGNGSICSDRGGHNGIDGVTGVGSEARGANAMAVRMPLNGGRYR